MAEIIKKRSQCSLILENKKGEILLQLRDNKSTIPYPDCWATFGGQIEKGETPEEAVIRETEEEINYDLKNPEYFGNFPFENYNIHVFVKKEPYLKIKGLNVNEGQRAGFFSLEKIRKLKCAFNTLEIAEAYFKFKKNHKNK